MARLHKATAKDRTSEIREMGGAFRRRLIASLLFWAISYLLFTVRAWLMQNEVLELANCRRLLVTFLGAVVLSGAAGVAGLAPQRSARAAAGLIAGAVAAGIAFMLGVRLGSGWAFAVPARDFASELLWVLVWAGYFLAALLVANIPAIHRLGTASGASSGSLAERREHESEAPPELWVQRRGFSARVPYEQIRFVRAEGNYVKVHYGRDSGLVRTSLSSVAQSLDSGTFIRIHRGVICRRSLIAGVRRSRSGTMHVLLTDGGELPMGRHYVENLHGVPKSRT